DAEVVATEARTQAAVSRPVATAWSMAREGRWAPRNRAALALHHLVATRCRGDALELICFGRYAQTRKVEELLALEAGHKQGTNLHHGLMLAGQFFRRHPGLQPVLPVVTDEEPTA